MRLAETVTFGGAGLDRAAQRRATARPGPGARVLALWRGKPLVEGGRAVRLDAAAVRDAPLLFLAATPSGDVFAADLSARELPGEAPAEGFSDATEQRHPDLPGAFVELRRVMTALPAEEAEMLAMARSVFSWHRTHGFCARCGAPTDLVQGGWQRACAACGALHFPRTDPVAIMLVTQGDSVLVGRSPGWPAGMVSLLAGYVEPGETLEAAVRREVFEEAGVRVGRVEYLASQPWPFPSSLMLACRAEALGREITLDPAELEEARWLDREALIDVLSGADRTLVPARPGAIARFVIEHWLADRLD